MDGPKYNEIHHRRISGESWSQSVNHLYFRENPIYGQSISRNSSATNFIVFRTLYYAKYKMPREPAYAVDFSSDTMISEDGKVQYKNCVWIKIIIYYYCCKHHFRCKHSFLRCKYSFGNDNFGKNLQREYGFKHNSAYNIYDGFSNWRRRNFMLAPRAH